MLFTNLTQFAALGLMLIVGWLFGLASHPGGKKWKRAYREEEAARTRDVAERDARIKELEAQLAAAPTVVEQRIATAPAAATAAAAAAPARKRGWFEWGGSDDLTRLRGVDGDLSRQLKGQGIDGYDDLASLSDADELALERRIDLPAGYIARERLREQARLLADGRADEHERAFQ